MSPGTSGRRVAVVTGGAGGIGAAIAESLGTEGFHVVTMDPVVSVDGVERLPEPEQSTARRIVDAGGSAQSSSTSVTDAAGVRELFDELVAIHGGVDAVVNVAGISRPTGFAKGDERDWTDVVDVHLNGYLNVLGAALPHMAAVGRGHMLGVTSGSGWRAADTGAYGCAKRAVASLTWQLGADPPTGVTVNALSPIAATRMVTAALARRRPKPSASSSDSSSTGGLALGNMPAAEDLGPVGAWLAGDEFGWSSGQVVFSGGSEVAVIARPALIEVVRTAGVTSLPHALGSVTAKALVAAEEAQVSNGGGNARFGAIFDQEAADPPGAAIASCVLVIDDQALEAAVARALEARGVACTPLRMASECDFATAAGALASVPAIDAVVVAPARPRRAPEGEAWRRILAEHAGIAEQIHTDAAWARACAERAAADDRPLRLLHLVGAATAGGRSRAQAATQLSRAAVGATDGRVTHLVVGIEAPAGTETEPIAEVSAHLLCSPETPALSGAELVVGPGWFGLRRHPQPAGSVTFGGPQVPSWLGPTLREIVGPSAAPPTLPEA